MHRIDEGRTEYPTFEYKPSSSLDAFSKSSYTIRRRKSLRTRRLACPYNLNLYSRSRSLGCLYRIICKGVIRVADTPVASLGLRLQMGDIRDIVQRLAMEHSFHKVGMSNPVESNEDTVYFAGCDQLFAFFGCQPRV
jgi:hypothetical protein